MLTKHNISSEFAFLSTYRITLTLARFSGWLPPNPGSASDIEIWDNPKS